MTNLNDIISTFSSEDQHRFITYLEKKNKRNDAKNVQLFNYLLNDTLNSNEICLKLYGSLKKDAYHALRKRLYQSIVDFIANNSIQEENSIDMQIIKYILASRSFLQHKQYKVAYKILDKAEILALEHYLFALLNEIYHTKIQYAYTTPSISIDELVSKFETNQKNLQLKDQLNIVYAKMKHTLNSITYKGDVVDFQTVLNQTLQEHHISINESMSFKSLYQFATIVRISAFVSKGYLQIEPFLINTYNIIITHKSKEKQLFYHIQIIYLIANTLFRNKKFNESFHYLELMHEHMLLKQKKYYNTYKLKYNLLLALNYNYSNKQKTAIEILAPLINNKHPDIESILDIHLSLIMFYFQKGNFKKTHTLFSKFYHTDQWYTEKAGKEWVIKKSLIEILLHIELKNIDLVESRLLSFKRNYYNYLKNIDQQLVITYLGFVESYYKTPELVTSNEFKKTVSQSFDWIDIHTEDLFVISFYSWLKGKMNNQDLYSTTLNLIRQSQKKLTNK